MLRIEMYTQDENMYVKQKYTQYENMYVKQFVEFNSNSPYDFNHKIHLTSSDRNIFNLRHISLTIWI